MRRENDDNDKNYEEAHNWDGDDGIVEEDDNHHHDDDDEVEDDDNDDEVDEDDDNNHWSSLATLGWWAVALCHRASNAHPHRMFRTCTQTPAQSLVLHTYFHLHSHLHTNFFSSCTACTGTDLPCHLRSKTKQTICSVPAYNSICTS